MLHQMQTLHHMQMFRQSDAPIHILHLCLITVYCVSAVVYVTKLIASESEEIAHSTVSIGGKGGIEIL